MSVAMQPGDAVVACIFGDGAAGEGIFHESVNLAAVWNLPVLYVCENNEWQAYVHRKETMLTESIASRAAAYGIEGISVDGNDVEAVYAATRDAVARIRKDRKPILLETRTYRTRGHYEPDDQAYVDKAELASWQARDPIESLRTKLIQSGVLTNADLASIDVRVRETLERAAAFAKDSPFPRASELHTDVYA